MRRRITGPILAMLAMSCLAAAPAAAGDPAPGDSRSLEDAERLARETAERLIETLRSILRAIPQYEAPIINENGDIVIRRKRPEPPSPPNGKDSTRI